MAMLNNINNYEWKSKIIYKVSETVSAMYGT